MKLVILYTKTNILGSWCFTLFDKILVLICKHLAGTDQSQVSTLQTYLYKLHVIYQPFPHCCKQRQQLESWVQVLLMIIATVSLNLWFLCVCSLEWSMGKVYIIMILIIGNVYNLVSLRPRELSILWKCPSGNIINFNNYSWSPNGLWVNSLLSRRPNALLTQRPCNNLYFKRVTPIPMKSILPSGPPMRARGIILF